MTWQRARQPEQVEERRRALLEATGQLLDEHGLEGTGLNALAQAAGASKANVYRYFESREAILLELMADEQQRWLQTVKRKWRELEGSSDLTALNESYANSLARRTRLCMLWTVLPTVLETNISEERVAEYKRHSIAEVTEVAGILMAAVPGLSAEHAQQFLILQACSACGLWPHCHPTPMVARLLKRKEFEPFRIDFARQLASQGEHMLRGMLAASDAKKKGG